MTKKRKTQPPPLPVKKKSRFKGLRVWIVLWLTVIVLVAVTWFRDRDFSTSSCTLPPDYQLVFDREENDISDLFIVNGDGSGLTNLTDSPDLDANPLWSPDGQMIAFDSRAPDGTWDIFVVDADGRNRRNLAGLRWDYAVDWEWSPDSRSIVYAMRDKTAGRWSIKTVNLADGQIASLAEYAGTDFPLWKWSPDGLRIAYVTPLDSAQTLRVANADGGGVVVLSETMVAGDMPSWSPDSQRIAFSAKDDTDPVIYVVDAAGGEAMRITDAPGARQPVWSPDGISIAYTAAGQLYRLDLEQDVLFNLTENDQVNTFLNWSPDGSRILYAAQSDEDVVLYTVDSYGDNPARVGGSHDFLFAAEWSPDGERFFFADIFDRFLEQGIVGFYLSEADGSSWKKLSEGSASNLAGVFSPDSRYLAYRGKGDTLYVVDTRTRDRCKLAKIGSQFDWRPVLVGP